MGVEDVIREAFNDAKGYKADWDAYDAKVAKGEHPIPPRVDLKLQASGKCWKTSATCTSIATAPMKSS